MKLITPPKLMPPFQSTAASGTLPTEPEDEGEGRVLGEEDRLEPSGRYESGEGAGDEQADHDVAEDGRPVHDEVLTRGGETGAREQALEERRVHLHGHVHGGVAFHRAGEALLCLLAGGLDEAPAEPEAEQQRDEDDHDRPGDEFGEGELPAHRDREDDAELEDEVG
jgi:hypothetical protein